MPRRSKAEEADRTPCTAGELVQVDNSILVFLSRTVCAAIALFRTLFTLQRGINTWGFFYVNKLILALYRKYGVIGSLFFPKTKERDCCVVFRCANT